MSASSDEFLFAVLVMVGVGVALALLAWALDEYERWRAER